MRGHLVAAVHFLVVPARVGLPLVFGRDDLWDVRGVAGDFDVLWERLGIRLQAHHELVAHCAWVEVIFVEVSFILSQLMLERSIQATECASPGEILHALVPTGFLWTLDLGILGIHEWCQFTRLH